MKELYDKARKRLPEVKAANVAGAYRVWSGAVSDLLPTGMTTAPGKHPDHGKMVCDERLNTMRKPCNQYTKAEVSEELSRHAPAPSFQREKNIRVFYEHRIVGQAFGVAGDIDIASFQPNLEQIQKFNREVEEVERERTGQNERERAQRERSVFRLR